MKLKLKTSVGGRRLLEPELALAAMVRDRDARGAPTDLGSLRAAGAETPHKQFLATLIATTLNRLEEGGYIERRGGGTFHATDAWRDEGAAVPA